MPRYDLLQARQENEQEGDGDEFGGLRRAVVAMHAGGSRLGVPELPQLLCLPVLHLQRGAAIRVFTQGRVELQNFTKVTMVRHEAGLFRQGDY